MRKILAIAVREYNAAVRTKSFIISLVVMPLMMGGAIAVQALLRNQRDITERKFAIVDRTSDQGLAARLEQAVELYNQVGIYDNLDAAAGVQVRPRFALERVPPGDNSPDAIAQQRFDLSEKTRRKEIFGFLEIGADVVSPRVRPAPGETAAQAAPAPPPGGTGALQGAVLPVIPDSIAIRYQSNSPTYDDFSKWAADELNQAVKERRFTSLSGLREVELKSILEPVRLLTKGLSTKNDATGKIEEASDENQIAAMMAPFGLIMLMFMLIMVGATPLTQSVIEEKLQRIAEVLLGSVRPFQLMLGKLLGAVGVSTTLSTIYLAGLYWAAHRFGFSQFYPLGILAWFFLFQILAVLMYGSLFIAVGAACTDIRETQTMLLPVSLVAASPMFVWLNVVRDPSSTFSTIASLLPNATPMLMVARIAIPPGIPTWQPVLGVALVLLATLACVYVAGRIFRMGILMQGKGANFKDLCRWVLRG